MIKADVATKGLKEEQQDMILIALTVAIEEGDKEEEDMTGKDGDREGDYTGGLQEGVKGERMDKEHHNNIVRALEEEAIEVVRSLTMGEKEKLKEQLTNKNKSAAANRGLKEEQQEMILTALTAAMEEGESKEEDTAEEDREGEGSEGDPDRKGKDNIEGTDNCQTNIGEGRKDSGTRIIKKETEKEIQSKDETAREDKEERKDEDNRTAEEGVVNVGDDKTGNEDNRNIEEGDDNIREVRIVEEDPGNRATIADAEGSILQRCGNKT